MVNGLVVDTGRNIMLDRTFNLNPTRTHITKFKVGIGTTEPTLADTDLESPVTISGIETVDDFETADWTDSADMTSSLNSTLFKENANSLNLVKDGTASTDANISKTTTSVDFTDKQLSFWLYVKDATALAKLATTGLIVRFGSDASNYYQWDIASSTLTAGQWNFVDDLTSANATSTTGTPTLTACDYSFIQLVATGTAVVWSAGDFMIDYLFVASDDDFVKNFETDYPVFDYTNNEVTIRCRLATTDSNSFPLTEFGLFNTDTTALMDSRNKFSQISKTLNDEVIFIVKNRIQ